MLRVKQPGGRYARIGGPQSPEARAGSGLLHEKKHLTQRLAMQARLIHAEVLQGLRDVIASLSSRLASRLASRRPLRHGHCRVPFDLR